MATSASCEAWTISMTHASWGQQIQCDDPPCVLLCSSIFFSDDVTYPGLSLPLRGHSNLSPSLSCLIARPCTATAPFPFTVLHSPHLPFLQPLSLNYWMSTDYWLSSCAQKFRLLQQPHTPNAASSRSAKRLGLEQFRSRDESLSWSVGPSEVAAFPQ